MTNTSDFKNCLHHIEVGHPDLETPLIASKAQRTFAFINTSKPSITFHM